MDEVRQKIKIGKYSKILGILWQYGQNCNQNYLLLTIGIINQGPVNHAPQLIN